MKKKIDKILDNIALIIIEKIVPIICAVIMIVFILFVLIATVIIVSLFLGIQIIHGFLTLVGIVLMYFIYIWADDRVRIKNEDIVEIGDRHIVTRKNKRNKNAKR